MSPNDILGKEVDRKYSMSLKVISGENLENLMQSLIYLYLVSETYQRTQIIK